jgi:MOSC domain-containing protein YiiM
LLKDGSTGFTLRVLRKGQVRIGDKAENVRKDENNVTVKDIVYLYILLEITQWITRS